MTRWHTDRPIEPVHSLQPLASPAAVDMLRTDSAARVSLRTAQAFYRRKLRQWAKDRASRLDETSDAD